MNPCQTFNASDLTGTHHRPFNGTREGVEIPELAYVGISCRFLVHADVGIMMHMLSLYSFLEFAHAALITTGVL